MWRAHGSLYTLRCGCFRRNALTSRASSRAGWRSVTTTATSKCSSAATKATWRGPSCRATNRVLGRPSSASSGTVKSTRGAKWWVGVGLLEPCYCVWFKSFGVCINYSCSSTFSHVWLRYIVRLRPHGCYRLFVIMRSSDWHSQITML